MKTRLCCAALLLALTGSGLAAYGQTPEGAGGWTYLVDAEHTGRVPEALPLPLVLVWKHGTGGTGTSVSTPAMDNDRVYFVAAEPPPEQPEGTMPGMMPGMTAPGMPPPVPGALPNPGLMMPGDAGRHPHEPALQVGAVCGGPLHRGAALEAEHGSGSDLRAGGG